MRYERENEQLKDKSRCAGVRANLKMCLLESDCCKIVSNNLKFIYTIRHLIIRVYCQILIILLF